MERERLSLHSLGITHSAGIADSVATDAICQVKASPKSTRRLVAAFAGPKRRSKPKYAIANLEQILYDNRDHSTNHMLLLKDSIIPVDPEHGPIDKRLIRCFSQDRAKVIAVVMLLSVSVTTVVAPLTFIWGGSWSNTEWMPGGKKTLVFDLLMDFVFLGTKLLSLNTSYLNHRFNIEVVDRRKIQRHLLLSPFYLLMLFSTTTHFWIGVCGAPMLFNAVKFARFFELLDLPDALVWWEETRRYRVSRLVVLLLGASHWVACLLAWGTGYREAMDLQGSEVFETTFNGESVPGWTSLYWMALVESVFLLCGALDNPVGDGSLREKNFGSLVFVTILGPVGCLLVAIFISAVVREQSLKYALEMRHEENKACMRRAMDSLKIPHELQRRVFSLHYFQRMSHDKEALRELLRSENLSKPLEEALKLYIYRRVLESGFLSKADLSYTLEVVRVLEDHTFVPGDYVCRRGEMGTAMFFVNQGQLLVLVPGVPGSDLINDAIGLAPNKTPGDYFGEIMLIKCCPRTAWVRAETYAVCAILSRSKVEAIWVYFPHERDRVVKSVHDTIVRDRWRNAQKHARCEPKGKIHGLVRKGADDERDISNGEANLWEGRAAAGERRTAASVRASDDDAEEGDGFTPPLHLSNCRHRTLSILEAEAAESDEMVKILEAAEVAQPGHQLEVICTEILQGQKTIQAQIEDLCARQATLEKLVRSRGLTLAAPASRAPADHGGDGSGEDWPADGAASVGRPAALCHKSKRKVRGHPRQAAKDAEGGVAVPSPATHC